MQTITPDLVRRAYAALDSGDMTQIRQYWAEDVHWLTPGNHALAGWHRGLDEFLGLMRNVGVLSRGSFHMTLITILTNDEYSVDITRNVGDRAKSPEDSSPYSKLDIDVLHLLRWRDGKIVEGRGAIFGDGTTRFNQFWSQVAADGSRVKQ